MLTLFRNRKRGQSTLEYAILVIIIIGALLSIQLYLKRNVQGGLKASGDQIGGQFSPGNTNVVKVMRTTSYTQDTFIKGTTRSEHLNEERTTELMNSEIMDQEYEYWGG